jgi:hypothetical protein
MPGGFSPPEAGTSFGGAGSFGSGGFSSAGGATGGFGAILSLGSYFYNLAKSGGSKIFITNPFQGFEDLFFEGKPVTADTIQAVLRAGASQNPVVKQYGKDLAVLERGGVVLSTSGGAGRSALNEIYSKAVSGLVAQGFSRQQANALLDNVISSHTASSGLTIPLPSPAPSVSRALPVVPTAPSVSSVPMNYFPSSSQDFSNQFLKLPTPQVPSVVQDLVPGAREFQDITGIDLFKPAPSMQEILSRGPVQNPFGGLLNSQSGQPYTPTASVQSGRQPMEIIDPRDCPSCNPQQAQERALLTSQEGQLQQELQTEQQQQNQQQDQQRQQQIEQFRQLEHQPAQQRNIPQEIQQKMNLLQQVGNELAQLQQEIDNQTPSGGNPPLASSGNLPAPSPSVVRGDGGGTPTIYGQPEPTTGTEDEHQHELEEQQIFVQQQPSDNGADPTKAVKFCVGCVTQNDALKFLNGEPSACSVMGYGNAE